MRYTKILLLLIILITLEETVRLWFVTPEQMAAHFNIVGQPDRFVTRTAFFAFQLEMEVISIALAIASPILIILLPAEFINLPNREYWLAPDRRAATVLKMRSFLEVLFSAILLVMLIGFELAVSANLQTPIVFNAGLMGLAIAGMVLFSLLSLVWLMWSFRIDSSG